MEFLKDYWPIVAGILGTVIVTTGIIFLIAKVHDNDIKGRVNNSIQSNLVVNIDDSGIIQLQDGQTISIEEKDIKALCIGEAQYIKKFTKTNYVTTYNATTKTTQQQPQMISMATLRLGCYEDDVSRGSDFNNKKVGDYIKVLIKYTIKSNGDIEFDEFETINDKQAEEFISQGVQVLDNK